MAQGFIGNPDFRRAGFGAILSIILSLQIRCKITSISKKCYKHQLMFIDFALSTDATDALSTHDLCTDVVPESYKSLMIFVEFGSARGQDFSWSYRSFCRRKVTSVSKNATKTNRFSSICVPGAIEIY